MPPASAEMDGSLAASSGDPRPGELRSEPGEVAALGAGSIDEGAGAVAVGPFDADLGAEALEDPADEAVIAGALRPRCRRRP